MVPAGSMSAGSPLVGDMVRDENSLRLPTKNYISREQRDRIANALSDFKTVIVMVGKLGSLDAVQAVEDLKNKCKDMEKVVDTLVDELV